MKTMLVTMMTFDHNEYMREYSRRRYAQHKQLRRLWAVFKSHASEINKIVTDDERAVLARAWELMEGEDDD
jgi:hypothetical protein